jgi:Nif-specific regulatory protein
MKKLVDIILIIGDTDAQNGNGNLPSLTSLDRIALDCAGSDQDGRQAMVEFESDDTERGKRLRETHEPPQLLRVPATTSREQLGALLEISQLLTSSTDLHQLLRVILDTVNQLVDADGSSLLLIDPLTNELTFHMPFDPGAADLKKVRLQPGQGIAGWVVRERRPLLVNDVQKDPRFYGQIDAMTGYQTKSVIAVPLVDHERVLGVVEVLNSHKETGFDQEDLDLVCTFATQASIALRNAQLISNIKEEKAFWQEEVQTRYRTLVGDSPLIQKVVQTARKAAGVDSTVLLLGESGTGKEIIARSIHAWSARASKPFRAINCAALSDHLLESELFGHEKGAYTGALQQKKGLFEITHGGTIFLDEIGDMKPELQAKLLRVLQDHEFERVGGTLTIRVDLRVIAATNQDLQKAVASGRFRTDLFYRLNVVSIKLPPLRDRREDIPALAGFFLNRYCQELNRSLTLDPEGVARLQKYDWPGNVRELENVIERAVVLAPGPVIGARDLVIELCGTEPEQPVKSILDLPYHEAVRAYKRVLIQHAIGKTGGQKTKAAALLGLNPTHLARLCKDLDVARADGMLPPYVPDASADELADQ